MPPADDSALVAALESSQRLGMLGDRPIPEVIAHARAFVAALDGVEGVVIDLGSGGGVPGLVIARARPDLHLVLVDRRRARTDHLVRLVRRLDLERQVTVRAEDALQLVLPVPADAAVARGFGPPDLTARAAGRLVRPGGVLVVSEPPEDRGDRWADVPGFVRVGGTDGPVAVLTRLDAP